MADWLFLCGGPVDHQKARLKYCEMQVTDRGDRTSSRHQIKHSTLEAVISKVPR